MDEKPTPPEGYELIRGCNISEVKEGYLLWDFNSLRWILSGNEGIPAAQSMWYAVPKAANVDVGPRPPPGCLRAIGGRVPIPVPSGLQVWDEVKGWVGVLYRQGLVSPAMLNCWHCWPGKMDDHERHISLHLSTLDPKKSAGDQKPQLQLIPPALNTETAKALARGAEKYGPWNWRDNKVEIMTYLGAMKRHIDCVINGEDLDPDTGAHHLGCVSASCGIILDAREHGTLVDNRPPKKQSL